jgi:hypothetical protein
LLLVISTFFILGLTANIIDYVYYELPDSRHKFGLAPSYDMKNYILIAYTALVVASCFLSLPFNRYFIGYDSGKIIYVYIFISTIIIFILYQTGITVDICNLVTIIRKSPILTLIAHIVLNFLYFFLAFCIIGFITSPIKKTRGRVVAQVRREQAP